MKATINELKKDNQLTKTSIIYTLKPREHYRASARFGRYMPYTLAQIKFFKQTGVCLDELGLPDAERIADIFKNAGKTAYFQYTKSRRYCRLLSNCSELWDIMLKQSVTTK